MTDDERMEFDLALGDYGLACITTANICSHQVLVARGAIAVLVDGILQRHDQHVEDLRHKVASLESYTKKLATRTMELEHKLILAERQIEQYERQ